MEYGHVPSVIGNVPNITLQMSSTPIAGRQNIICPDFMPAPLERLARERAGRISDKNFHATISCAMPSEGQTRASFPLR